MDALVLLLSAFMGKNDYISPTTSFTSNPTYSTSITDVISYPDPTPEQLKVIQMAEVQNNYVAQRFSTKNSLYRYKNEQLTILNQFVNAFMALYFILAGIYLSIVIIDTTKIHSYHYKITLLLCLVSFPFVITPIEFVIYDVVMYLARFAFGVVAVND